jgi:hypothetical protein
VSDARPSRIDRSFLTLGAVLLAVSVALIGVGMAQAGGSPKLAAQSYVYAFAALATVTFGFFGLSLLHHTAKGHWGYPTMRLLEAGGGWRAILLVAVAWLPIAFLWTRQLYPWTDPAVVAADPHLQHKAPYLNLGRWTVFGFVALAAFAFWAYRNSLWLRNQEKDGDPKWRDLRTNWSAPGLVMFVVFANFLFTDWVMSQDPKWSSTIYGVWFIVGGVLAALGIVAVVLGTQAKKSPYDTVVAPWLTRDVGNLMLAFTMLWAYFSFSQYLIIWSGNLPEYTPYWIRRSNGGWHTVGNTLMVAQFFVPFLLLLIPKVKRVPILLAAVGAWVVAWRMVDFQYIVAPTFRPEFAFVPLDLGFLLALFGVWCLNFGHTLSQSPLLLDREAIAKPMEVAPEHA